MEKPIKLASGKWRARVYIDGTRISLGTFDTYKQAMAEMVKAHADEARTIQKKVRGGERFGTFAERVLFTWKRKGTAGSWDNSELNLRRWVQPYFRDMRLRDIRPRHVDEWFATRGTRSS